MKDLLLTSSQIRVVGGGAFLSAKHAITLFLSLEFFFCVSEFLNKCVFQGQLKYSHCTDSNFIVAHLTLDEDEMNVLVSVS